MTAKPTEYTVYVKRSPYSSIPRDSGCILPLSELWDIEWDWETGGYRQNTATCFLMGKITLEVAQGNPIGLTGDHSDYSSGIKVCIIKKYTPKETWKHLVGVYGPSPDWGSKKGETPCTTQIINLLKTSDDQSMTRKDLRNRLRSLGYDTARIGRAIRRMSRDKRIFLEGSSNSPCQKIRLPEQM